MKKKSFSKKIIVSLLACAVLAGGAITVNGLMSGEALARTKSGQAEILIVNASKIISDSKVGKSLQKQYQEKLKKIQDGAIRESKKLDANVKKIENNKSLSKDQMAQRLVDVQAEQDQDQKNYNEKAQTLRAGVTQAQSKINGVLEKIINKEFKRKNAAIVIPSNIVIAFQGPKALDITNTVIKNLNRQMSHITLRSLKPSKK